MWFVSSIPKSSNTDSLKQTDTHVPFKLEGFHWAAAAIQLRSLQSVRRRDSDCSWPKSRAWCGQSPSWVRWIPASGRWREPGRAGWRSPEHTEETEMQHEPLWFTLVLRAMRAFEEPDTLVHAELMTDLWKSPSTNTWEVKGGNKYEKKQPMESMDRLLPTRYPYTNVPLLQPSSSRGGLSQPIIRLPWPTVLITSTDWTSAGASGGREMEHSALAICNNSMHVTL